MATLIKPSVYIVPMAILDGARNDTLYRLGRKLKAQGLGKTFTGPAPASWRSSRKA